MRSITVTRHGGPEVLEVRESADPSPERGQVRLRIKACGLNFAELMARQGLYPEAPKPPCVVGYEASGVIDAVGEGVQRFKVGDRVLACRQFGMHADTACMNEGLVFPMPDEMSFEEAAAIPVNYLTAYHMLFRVASVRPGERVLIHMAAGGVGIAVLQLCKTIGGVVTFGTASANKHDMIREHGCDHPIDYHTSDYAQVIREITKGEGIDVVLDPLGGSDWRKGYNLLREVGRLVAFGFSNMVTGSKRNLFNVGRQLLSVPKWSPINVMQDNRSVIGVNMNGLWGRLDILGEEIEAILEFYKQGQVKPLISSTFPFDQAAEAHRHMESHKNVGKIILVP